MTKEEILDYVTETPGNTNRAVLSGMLNDISSGSSGSSSGVRVYEGTYDPITLHMILEGTYNDIMASKGGLVHIVGIDPDTETEIEQYLMIVSYMSYDGVYQVTLGTGEIALRSGGPDDSLEYPYDSEFIPDGGVVK